ncbi:MAG: hypothetical protein WCA13_02570 [Terriglobales bacterium]
MPIVAVLIFLVNCFVLVGGAGQSQNHTEPFRFLEQYIGLKDDQIASIDHGKAVAQVLPTPEPSEVVIFGAVYINASCENYLKAAQNLDSLRGCPAISAFGNSVRRRNCRT